MHYIAHFAFKGGLAARTGFLFMLTHEQVLVDEVVCIYAAGGQVR
jgi:hypothetical protein